MPSTTYKTAVDNEETDGINDAKPEDVEIEKEVNDEIDKRPAALDGGWGWMVVLGTAICHVVFGIIVRAFGVTYIELLQRFHGTATATSWIGAINMSAAGILGKSGQLTCLRLVYWVSLDLKKKKKLKIFQVSSVHLILLLGN